MTKERQEALIYKCNKQQTEKINSQNGNVKRTTKGFDY